VIWSPDGQYIITQLISGIQVYDATTLRELWSSQANGFVMDMAIDISGGHIAVADVKAKEILVTIFSVADGKVIATISVPSDIIRQPAIALSTESSVLAVFDRVDGAAVYLYSVVTGELIGALEGEEELYTVAFSPDGTTLTVADRDYVTLWNIDTRSVQHYLDYHMCGSGSAVDVDYAPGAHVLAIGLMTGGIALWDTVNKELDCLTARSSTTWGLMRLAFVDEAALVTWWGPIRELAFWSIAEQTRTAAIELSGYVWGFSPSPSGEFAAVAVGTELQIWDIRTGESPIAIDYSVPMAPLGFSADGCCVALFGNNRVQFRDIASWQATREVKLQSDSSAAALDREWTSLAVGHEDGTISLINARTGDVTWTTDGHQEPVKHLVFRPDGLLLASSTGAETLLWDVETGNVLETRSFGKRPMAFTPDGDKLLFSDPSVLLRVKDVESYEQVSSIVRTEGFASDYSVDTQGIVLVLHNYHDGTYVVQEVETERQLVGHLARS